jgi:hypothetical protein
MFYKSPSYRETKRMAGEGEIRKELYSAIVRGDIAEIKKELERGVPVNAVYNGFPIAYIAQNGPIASLKAVLDGGVDVNQQGKLGYAALHMAVIHQPRSNSNKKLAVVKLLLERGADPMITDSGGNDAVYTAKNFCKCKKTIKLLEKACKEI